MSRDNEIRAREQAATQGPWSTDGFALFNDGIGEFEGLHDTDPDAIFIAHAREDIPWLLDEKARLEARIEDLEAELVRYKNAEKHNCESAGRTSDGKCIGFQRSEYDDEPSEQCKTCSDNQFYEEE